MMKRNRLFSIIATLILTAAASATAAAALAQDEPPSGELGIARVSYLTGDVLFNSADDEEWAALSPNFPLRDGDRLWAGEDSKLEVRFTTGETAWLNYQSELDIIKLVLDENGNAYQTALPYGEASFFVDNFEVLGSVFQVDTPNTSIRAYGRALFRVTSLLDGATQVGVSEGSVEVESEYGVANVHSGELLEVYDDGSSRIMDLPGRDDWDEWVDSRLDRYNRPYRSARYLPNELHEYAYEFDEGGRWESYPDYGYVWVPSVSVGWSPYSYGRWAWVGWDYVWLPYDPWYAPFHYGRWRWTVSFGWCWVPPLPRSVYWSPGYVGWVWDRDYVYWCPLAPGEVYFGYGYYGPNSVNIYKTTVIVNKNTYINSTAANAVVVVNRNNFLEGRTVRVKDKKASKEFRERIVRTEVGRERMLKEKIDIGAPPVNAIKPVRDTRLPKPDFKVEKKDMPPARLEKRQKFTRERSIVKGEVKSAFGPERRPRSMKGLERIQQPGFKRNGRIERQEQRIEQRPARQERRIEQPPTRQERRIEQPPTRQERRIEQPPARQERRIEQQPARQERRIEQQPARQERRIEQPPARQERRIEQQPARQERRIEQPPARQERRIKQQPARQERRIEQQPARQERRIEQPPARQERRIEQQPARQERRIEQPPARQERRIEQPPARQERRIEQPPARQERRIEQQPARQERRIEQPPARQERGIEQPPARQERRIEQPPARQERRIEQQPATQQRVIQQPVTKQPVRQERSIGKQPARQEKALPERAVEKPGGNREQQSTESNPAEQDIQIQEKDRKGGKSGK